MIIHANMQCGASGHQYEVLTRQLAQAMYGYHIEAWIEAGLHCEVTKVLKLYDQEFTQPYRNAT